RVAIHVDHRVGAHVGDGGLLQQLPRLGPARRVVLAIVGEHAPDGGAAAEHGARHLEDGVVVEVLDESIACLVVDAAHAPLDEIADLEPVEPLGGQRHARHGTHRRASVIVRRGFDTGTPWACSIRSATTGSGFWWSAARPAWMRWSPYS